MKKKTAAYQGKRLLVMHYFSTFIPPGKADLSIWKTFMSTQLLEVISLIKLIPCYLHNFFYPKHNAQGLLMFTNFGVVNFLERKKRAHCSNFCLIGHIAVLTNHQFLILN